MVRDGGPQWDGGGSGRCSHVLHSDWLALDLTIKGKYIEMSILPMQ